MAVINNSLPPIPENYVCKACNQIGEHWIMNCNMNAGKANAPEFCKYPHDYYSIVGVFGEYPINNPSFSDLLATDYQTLSNIHKLIPFMKQQKYIWFQFSQDKRIIRVGTLINNNAAYSDKIINIEIESFFDMAFKSNPKKSLISLQCLKWIGIIEMQPKYKIIKNNLTKLEINHSNYNSYNKRRLKHANDKNIVYSKHANNYFMIESSSMIVYDPVYGKNLQLYNVEIGKWLIRYDGQLLIEHESVYKSNSFLEADTLFWNDALDYNMFDKAKKQFMNNEVNKTLLSFWVQGLTHHFEEYCAERVSLLSSILSFPKSICEIIVNVFEINAQSNYWWYIDKSFYEDIIGDNWEFPWDPEVGFESDTIGIFDCKHVNDEECVEQKIKDECELLFVEYGYNEIYEDLWGMMYSETLHHVSQKQDWCALPFGVAAYKAPYESESLLVKRNHQNNKINAVVIAHLWGD